ncbi:Putative inner membrane protein [hydrothermal vent metagenome]|uniref:Inner membrane protein n=1 Tax=hydrothermal vent metagenome TaxID=652676 RepID=A0A3B0ZCX1_9ZZZZ
MKLIKWLKQLRIRYILRRYPISRALWKAVILKAGLLRDLSSVEKARLRELATLFLHQKSMTGAHDLRITDEMAVIIAAQAALPILELGLDYYSGWVEIIIYPGAFRVSHEGVDQNGLVSSEARNLSGESWLRGPVILSWEDVENDLDSPHPGHNVVVHEFAHKLDMLNGRANGMPPLHPRMEIEQWTQALSAAFDVLQQQIAHQHPTRINAYAATTPAEYFAVVSEYFFTAPDVLMHHCPEVYRQLTQFYRQDPFLRRRLSE